MDLRMVIGIGLIVISLAISGCCSCCSSLTSTGNTVTELPTVNVPSDNNQGTSTGGMGDLIGIWSWGESTTYVYSSSGGYAGYSGIGGTVVFNENGTFSFSGVFPAISGSGPAYVFMGRYRVNGDTIKYTNIVKYYYSDMSKVAHTTTKIADTSGTYRIEAGDDYDTIHLQANGLWDNESEFHRYKSD